MPSQVGLRVVRGPDWKWGDQDGGVGHAGTVIPTSKSNMEKLGPRTVTVLWDSGKKSSYQGGPKGSYDLRIINNSALGVKHTNIPCGDDSCWVQEIQGIRWQCVTCNINLCTNCFLKKVPHNKEHVRFKRYSREKVENPPIVSCWGDDGPDSRIELKGMYPGATVSLGPDWPYGREGEIKSGLVIATPKEEFSGNILIEWLPDMERSRHKRIEALEADVDNSVILRLSQSGTGGFYLPHALPRLHISVAEKDSFPAFHFGDRVQIDPSIKPDYFRKKQTHHGGYIDGMKDYVGEVGTVQFMKGSSVNAKFKAKNGDQHVCWRFNPSILKKLNKFSVNQVIRIRKDVKTISLIDQSYEEPDTHKKLIGAIGRVTDIDDDNPEELYIHFDDPKVYTWISKSDSFSSEWMELLESTQPAVEKELAEWIEKGFTFFFDAITRGDLRTAKLVHMHHNIVSDARNSDGRTALHIACLKGYKEIVKWLIEEVKADVELPDENDRFFPIHYSVDNCMPEVLKLLIENGANLNSKDDDGNTALHLAAWKKFTECSLPLINAGCDVNIQDSEGYTPLHLDILNGNALYVSQILSRPFVNFDLKDEDGFNVLHLAVVRNDLKAIELLLEQKNIKGPLLDIMPDSKSTVLHYACIHKNYQVAKLLVEKSRRWKTSDGSSLLTELLNVTNESGVTAFAIACQQKNSALIELLVGAGADFNVLDEEGNSAILLAATSPAEDKIPTLELCPSIFKIYQSVNDDPNFKTVKNKTILSQILFLMTKGCCVNATNKAGIKLDDFLLLEKGYPENIIKLLNQFIQKSEKTPSIGSGGCMGRPGCAQPPAFQLSCPHKKEVYKACSKCFLPTVDGFKCGCPEEEILPIPNSSQAEVVSSIEGTRNFKEEQIAYELKWVNDESKNGKIEDQIGNEYIWSGTRKDGGIGYRCSNLFGRKSRCTAVARRYIKKNEDGTDKILLESPHHHPESKRKLDCVKDQDGDQLTPSAKRKRNSVNTAKC